MMRKLLFLSLTVCVVSSINAQSVDQLIEAYKRGDISQADIEQAVQIYSNKKPNNVLRNSPVVRDVVSKPRVDTIVAKPYGEQEHAIYGHSFFGETIGGFEPDLNIATPHNYILGVGDELIIDVWGDAQQSQGYTISPDGDIYIDGVGRVPLVGCSINQAEKRLRSTMRTIYAGLDDGRVKMAISLGRIRSIKVFIVGEVVCPGGYTVPSLATLFHLLHLSGGVTDRGSVRNIIVVRSDGKSQEIDLYDYILQGDSSTNIVLREGDLVFVGVSDIVVDISGEIKRPLRYEMRRGENIAQLVDYAGGFAADANRNAVSVVRRRGGYREHYTLRNGDFNTFLVEDGDSIVVGSGIDRDKNRVTIQGAVWRSGDYSLDDDLVMLSELINRADGLRDDAYMERALLYREGKDWRKEIMSVNLNDILSGETDCVLQPNDRLVVLPISQLMQEYMVTIFGAVQHPGKYPYAENMSLKDLLLEAGGLLQEASYANIAVTRRIRNPESLKPQDRLFESFQIDLSDSLNGNSLDFKLSPFDEVYVRRSPVYITQSSVDIKGEVAFEGNYPLLHRNMRLSEAIADAGGINPGAFVEGAYLLRRMTKNEQAQYDALQGIIQRQTSAMSVDSMVSSSLMDVYPVGINLAEALNNPGSDSDVVLRDGDVITVPKYNGTVRVMGAVLYPNSVTFRNGENMRYYVKSAGGFDNRARRRDSFVIYMNGMVAAGLSAQIRPGCIIIVPSKSSLEPFRWSEVMSLLSTTASTAAIVVSLINLAT